ncbi:MAG: hypothetical protein N2C14_14145, partial [Planctomycetales bacterium]
MRMGKLLGSRALGRWLMIAGFAATLAVQAKAQAVVPGTGSRINYVGDDFEDEDWRWIPNSPKASKNLDGAVRGPVGRSVNGRWRESSFRGQPDLIKRVPTPEGGLAGSSGSLMFRTFYSGLPGKPSRERQQDDFVINISSRLRKQIPVAWTPSCVVRVYLPPFEQWEKKTGSSFAFRADCLGSKSSSGGFFGSSRTQEAYWPGIFIHLNSRHDRRFEEDSAYFIIRSDVRGRDIRGPNIDQLGWWTLGMSCTPDGQCHYYARPGVGDLTREDHITSRFCYGFKCNVCKTFFFNVFNANDGRNWSSAWVIDDPEFYLVRSDALYQAMRPRNKSSRYPAFSDHNRTREILP